MASEFTLHVNGVDHQVVSDAERPLLQVLREDLELTGTKYGCGEGECGACTVLMDGYPERSCLTPIEAAVGSKIETIEGLANGQSLHPVQQAFIDQAAMQCGYCVPGQIMSVVALLRDVSQPTREQIVEAMNGNICRCCNYTNIRAAVEQAARAS